MTLVLLCAAQEMAVEAEAGAGQRGILRALLPIAGMTLIEQQAERARAIGAERMLLLVDGVPAELAAACDRIRARGMAIAMVRDSEDVRAAAADATRILLAGDGLVAGAEPWAAMATQAGSAILVTADTVVTSALERIDAGERWAGLAVLPGDALEWLVGVAPDWDPQLTLLRYAVQTGVARLPCDAALFVRGDMAMADSAEAAAGVANRLMARASGGDGGVLRGPGERWLVGPLVRLVSGPLLSAQASGKVARGVTAVGFVAALGAALAGYRDVALIGALLAMVSDVIARHVAAFRPESRTWRMIGEASYAAQAAALALLGSGAGAAFAVDGSGLLLATGYVLANEAGRSGDWRARWLVDGALAWPLLALAAGTLGWSLGPLAVAGLVGGVLAGAAIAGRWLPKKSLVDAV